MAPGDTIPALNSTTTIWLASNRTVFSWMVHSMIRLEGLEGFFGWSATIWISSFRPPRASTLSPSGVTVMRGKRLRDTLTYFPSSPSRTQPFSSTGDSCRRSNWWVSFATITGRSFRILGRSASATALGPSKHPDFTASWPSKQAVGLWVACQRRATQPRAPPVMARGG